MQISPTITKPNFKASSLHQKVIKPEQAQSSNQYFSELFVRTPEIGPKDLYSTIHDEFSQISSRKDCYDLKFESYQHMHRAGAQDLKPYRVNFIHNYACEKAKTMVPTGSPYQISLISKQWPALAQVVKIAEDSAAYLKGLERDKKPSLLAPKQKAEIEINFNIDISKGFIFVVS